MVRALASCLLLLGATGCASLPIPSKQLTDAKATIRAAASLGAANYPPAQMAVERARDKIEKGEDMINDDELEEATLLLERAVVDAELALALTKRERARVEARRATRQVQSFESQN